MVAPVLPQDSRNLAEILDPIVDRVFLKSFNKSGVNGKWVRDDALGIIREQCLDNILTEEHARDATGAFQDMLCKGRVARGQAAFLNLESYG